MSSSARHHAILYRLARDGSLPESASSRSLLKFLSPQIQGGILDWQKSGAGRRLAVINANRFAGLLAREFPHGQEELAHAPVRLQGVGRFRNSKAVRGASDEIVCVRGWQDGALRRGGNPIAVTSSTRDHGVFAFLLTADAAYQLQGSVATVENPTLFALFEQLHPGFDLALYTKGRLSRRVISWLAAQTAPGLHIVHFGDYDPVGLDEYRRLTQACGCAASLYCPTNLPQLFQRYGNRELLKGARSQALLKRLRGVEDADIRAVVKLIDAANGGLEQEGLLLAKG